MAPLRRLPDHEVEAVLAGASPAADLERLAALVRRLRADAARAPVAAGEAPAEVNPTG